MSKSLTEDFKTAAEVFRSPKALLDQIKRTGRPLVVTLAGKPATVVMNIEQYERLVHLINLSRLLNEAEKDLRQGRTQPLEVILDELNLEQKTPGNNHRRRKA